MTVVLEHSFIIILLGGVSFFLMGLGLVTTGLNEVFSSRIHTLMQKLSKSYVLAGGVGFGLTVLSQSSGAVTSMLVRLGSAGVLTLKEVMGVIVGSSVGSTMIVLLFTFKLADFGLPIFILAFLVSFFAKRSKVRYLMNIFMGLGLIFFGIELIGIGGKGFLEFPYFSEFAEYLKGRPWVLLIVAALFCSMVQSSAAAIGFAMGLAQAGVLGVPEILIWVIGANIGTTSVALIASIGGNYVGRRVAWAHVLYRVSTAMIVFFLVGWFEPYFQKIPSTASEMAAHFHLGMNIFGALVFSPFYKLGIRLIEICVPSEKGAESFGAKFLDRDNYQSSTMAIANAEREIMRLSEIILSMVRDSIKIFNEYDTELVESLKERDSMVDHLYREVKMYLARDVSRAGTQSYNRTLKLIFFADDLERAGDVVDGSLIDLAKKKHDLKLDFSDEGWNELTVFHQHLMRLATMANQHFFYPGLQDEVQQVRKEFRRMEMKIRESHIERLNEGLTETIKTSSIHLDLLSEFGRLAALMTRHRKYTM